MKWLAAALAVALAAAGCIDDHYECKVDSDCNVGVAGRCELDHHCTLYDPSCPLARRYTAHSGAQSNACFADAIVPLDPCAPGQPPSLASDPCAASVCAREPTCCTTAWTEACVQLAQLSCPSVTCDTRLALTAENTVVPGSAATYEAFDLRLAPTRAPMYMRVDASHKGFLDWLAPARGQTEPRLASLDGNKTQLVIDGVAVTPVDTSRGYDGVRSIDFDRDGRDIAALTSFAIPDDSALDLLDLETGGERMLSSGMQQMTLATFGDWDGDAFPDVVAAEGGSTQYALYHNIDDPDDHLRKLFATWMSGATGATTGNVPLQAFEWIDVDGDGVEDLVESGAEIRIHFGGDDRLPDNPRIQIDCDPPMVNPPGNCNGGVDVEVVGAVVALAGSKQLVISIDNGTRNLYAVDFNGRAVASITPILQQTCSPAPCAPIRAIVARDVDGDHRIDLIAIDAAMTVYVLPNGGKAGVKTTIMPPSIAPATTFRVVHASTTGAPL